MWDAYGQTFLWGPHYSNYNDVGPDLSCEKTLKAICRQPLGRGGLFSVGASLAGCYVRASFPPPTSTPTSKFPILINRGVQEPRQKIHATTVLSQMWEEPTLSCFSFYLLQDSRPKEKGKKKIFLIILLNKSLYFKKFLVFGEEKCISDMVVPKTFQ